MSLYRKILALNQIEFVRHGKNYLAGNFMVQGLAFVSIPILTRMLNPDDYGMIAVFVSMVSIFLVLLSLNFQSSIGRKYYEKDESFGEFVFTNVRFISVFSLFLVGLCAIFSGVISEFFEAPREVLFLALGVSFFSIFSNMYMSYLQASQQSRKYAVLAFIQAASILALTISLLLFLADRLYLSKMLAQLSVVIVLALYSLVQLRKLMKPKWDLTQVKYALHLGVPLIPHTLSGFLLSSSDRIIINQLTSAAQTGLYSLAYNVGSLLMIIIGGLNNAWVPILFRNLNEGKYEEIQRKSDLYALVIIAVAFGLSLFAREVVVVMASPKYYGALAIIPVIVLGSVFIFLYQLCVNYTFYHKKNIFISINTMTCGGINIGLNYLFIPRYGYMAAAWTTLASYLLLFIMNYFTAAKLMKGNMMKFGFKLTLLGATVLFYFACAAVLSLTPEWYLAILVKGLAFGVYALLMYGVVRSYSRHRIFHF